MSRKYGIRNTMQFGLKEMGTDVTIWYRTSTTCACDPVYDPIYGTYMKPNCATCDGSGKLWTSTSKHVVGWVNQFSGGLKYVEDGQYKHNIAPMGIAKGVFWNDDVLTNHHSVHGPNYFTNCQTVEAYGGKFSPKNITLVGVHPDEMAVVVTFDKIEN